jgi:hypothetical protein
MYKLKKEKKVIIKMKNFALIAIIILCLLVLFEPKPTEFVRDPALMHPAMF